MRDAGRKKNGEERRKKGIERRKTGNKNTI